MFSPSNLLGKSFVKLSGSSSKAAGLRWTACLLLPGRQQESSSCCSLAQPAVNILIVLSYWLIWILLIFFVGLTFPNPFSGLRGCVWCLLCCVALVYPNCWLSTGFEHNPLKLIQQSSSCLYSDQTHNQSIPGLDLRRNVLIYGLMDFVGYILFSRLASSGNFLSNVW